MLDSRNGIGGTHGAVGAGRTVSFAVDGSTVPAGALDVVLQVTGVDPTRQTYITAYPTGQTRPDTSNLNITPDVPRATK